MILMEGDIDLQRNREQLARPPVWGVSGLRIACGGGSPPDKEAHLERVYAEKPAPARPRRGRVKALLLHCLEAHHYFPDDQTGFSDRGRFSAGNPGRVGPRKTRFEFEKGGNGRDAAPFKG